MQQTQSISLQSGEVKKCIFINVIEFSCQKMFESLE